ncbi:diadenosine tetraphosphatase, partial [mine drainage metagenome]
MAAIYAMGDLQGCYAPFSALLEQVGFTPQIDQLWLAGDLVNRGPDSHAVINRLYTWHERVR